MIFFFSYSGFFRVFLGPRPVFSTSPQSSLCVCRLLCSHSRCTSSPRQHTHKHRTFSFTCTRLKIKFGALVSGFHCVSPNGICLAVSTDRCIYEHRCTKSESVATVARAAWWLFCFPLLNSISWCKVAVTEIRSGNDQVSLGIKNRHSVLSVCQWVSRKGQKRNKNLKRHNTPSFKMNTLINNRCHICLLWFWLKILT